MQFPTLGSSRGTSSDLTGVHPNAAGLVSPDYTSESGSNVHLDGRCRRQRGRQPRMDANRRELNLKDGAYRAFPFGFLITLDGNGGAGYAIALIYKLLNGF